MIEDIRRKLSSLAPLRVRRAEYDGYYSFVFGGDDWAVAITSPWRILMKQEILVDFGMPDASDDVWELIGRDLVDIDQRSTQSDIDPSFSLSGDIEIQVFSDNHIDPWIVYIGDNAYVSTAESQAVEQPPHSSRSSQHGSLHSQELITSVQVEKGILRIDSTNASRTLQPPWRALRSGTLVASSDLVDRHTELNGVVGREVLEFTTSKVGSITDSRLAIASNYLIENFPSSSG